MLAPYALRRLAFADLLSGDWSGVRWAAEELITLSADIGAPASRHPHPEPGSSSFGRGGGDALSW